jgi:hypothetical protein
VNDLLPAFAAKTFGLDVVKLDYKITGAPANRQIDGLFLDVKSETFIIVESKMSMSLSAYVSSVHVSEITHENLLFQCTVFTSRSLICVHCKLSCSKYRIAHARLI